MRRRIRKRRNQRRDGRTVGRRRRMREGVIGEKHIERGK